MNNYEVVATEKIRSMGIFKAETEEEAIEKFRVAGLKLDYTTSELGYLSSGWNPVATIVGDDE